MLHVQEVDSVRAHVYNLYRGGGQTRTDKAFKNPVVGGKKFGLTTLRYFKSKSRQ